MTLRERLEMLLAQWEASRKAAPANPPRTVAMLVMGAAAESAGMIGQLREALAAPDALAESEVVADRLAALLASSSVDEMRSELARLAGMDGIVWAALADAVATKRLEEKP